MSDRQKDGTAYFHITSHVKCMQKFKLKIEPNSKFEFESLRFN